MMRAMLLYLLLIYVAYTFKPALLLRSDGELRAWSEFVAAFEASDVEGMLTTLPALASACALSAYLVVFSP